MVEDPLGVPEQLDNLLGPNTYAWYELMSKPTTLFSGEERQLIRNAAIKEWEKRNPVGQDNNIPGDQKFPIQKPNWNNNVPEHRKHMEDLRKIIIDGIKEAVPRSQNARKALEIRQKDEPPSSFLQRLKEAMRKYAGMNPVRILDLTVSSR